MPHPSVDTTVIDWWREHQSQLPLLANMAFRVLSVPTAVTAAESIKHYNIAHDNLPRDISEPNVKKKSLDIKDVNMLKFLASDW